jgi:hypothetical protein
VSDAASTSDDPSQLVNVNVARRITSLQPIDPVSLFAREMLSARTPLRREIATRARTVSDEACPSSWHDPRHVRNRETSTLWIEDRVEIDDQGALVEDLG